MQRSVDAVTAAVRYDADVVVADDRLPDGGGQALAVALTERESRAQVVRVASSMAPLFPPRGGWRADTSVPADATGIEWHAALTARRRTR